MVPCSTGKTCDRRFATFSLGGHGLTVLCMDPSYWPSLGGMIISWLLPPDHLQVEYLPGGHGFPYPNSEKITQTILSFWNSKSSPVLRKNSSNLCSPWECDSIGFCLLGNDRRPEDFIDVQLRIILINRCKCGVGGNTTSTLYILAFHQLQKC